MNHARIAGEALKFRISTLSPNVSITQNVDTGEAGKLLAACGDPDVDKAIRALGDTWRKAGLPSESIGETWTEEQVSALRKTGGYELLDTLDELVNGISRCKIR